MNEIVGLLQVFYPINLHTGIVKQGKRLGEIHLRRQNNSPGETHLLRALPLLSAAHIDETATLELITPIALLKGQVFLSKRLGGIAADAN